MVTTTRNIWRQEFLRPGTYHGHPVTRDDLVEFARNTNHILERGYAVPVFERHKPLGSEDGGPRFIQPGEQDDATDTVGWLKKVEVDDDGRAFHVIEVTDPKASEKIANKSIRFTSPELTYSYCDADGNHIGKLIRHVALTPTPRNPHQGPFVAMSEPTNPMQCVQFSLDDLDKPKKKLKDSDTLEEDNTGDEEGDADTQNEMDIPPSVSPSQRLGQGAMGKRILADLEAAGIAAPQGIDPIKQPYEFLCQLSASLRQKAITEAEMASKQEQQDMSVTEESGYAQYAQFAESHPDPTVRQMAAALVKAENDKRAAQLATHRNELVGTINAAHIPPWAKKRLADVAGAVQFSEDGTDEPAMRIGDVLELLKQATPKSMQFSETELQVYEHESGEDFHAESPGELNDDKADEIASVMAGQNYSSIANHSYEFTGAGAGYGRNDSAPRKSSGQKRR